MPTEKKVTTLWKFLDVRCTLMVQDGLIQCLIVGTEIKTLLDEL